MKVRCSVCRWMDREEFLEMIRIAEYVGRSGGCSVFEFYASPEKLSEIERFLELTDRVGCTLEDRDRRALESIVEESYKVKVGKGDGYYLIRSRRILADYLAPFRENGLVSYSRELRGFKVKPYAIIDVVERLTREGFIVEDSTGLLRREGELKALEFKGKLRPYQREALEAWVQNNYRGVIALPTGAGKTVIALAAIARLKLRTLVIVYTKEQMLEWREKILSFLNISPLDVGLFYSDEKSVKPITIATYQSAYRNTKLLHDKFSLLIIDEAHHLPADKFKLIAEHILAPYRMGLSATPYREDGKHEELFRLVGGIVYEKSLAELMEKGFIASFTVIPVLVSLQPDEKKVFDMLRREYNLLARGRKVEELVKAAAAGEESARKALQLLNKMRRILALTDAKVAEAKRIVEYELSRGSKVIIFTQYVEQAEKVAKNLGIPVVTGRMDRRKRKLIFELFKSGRYRAIVLTTVGDEGIDVPDANVGIILSGTSSRRQFIQRLGRLLRPQEGKQSRLYYIAVKGSAEEATLKRLAEAVRNLALA